jgi:hypothetical protein
MLTAIHFRLAEQHPDPEATSLKRLREDEAARAEALELLDVLADRTTHIPIRLQDPDPARAVVPLSVHCRYSLDDILAAAGRSTLTDPYRIREGTYFDKISKTDFFFVTLEKTEKHYSPSTLYRDYAISDTLFHWESQSTTSEGSPTGQRHVRHAAMGVRVLLFVRERMRDAGLTLPYQFLGPAHYVSHVGERPMAITWRLHYPIPADLYRAARLAAG